MKIANGAGIAYEVALFPKSGHPNWRYAKHKSWQILSTVMRTPMVLVHRHSINNL
jgi:hypothetical protein